MHSYEISYTALF